MTNHVRNRPTVSRRSGVRGRSATTDSGIFIPAELGLFRPGDQDSNGRWFNVGTGGSAMSLDTIQGNSSSMTRTTDSVTGLEMSTLTVNDANLVSNTGVTITPGFTTVMFADVAAPSGVKVLWNSRDSSTEEYFLYNSGSPGDWTLGAGASHATQTFQDGRQIIATRRHDDGDTVDFYVMDEDGNGSDIRDHVMTSTDSTWEFCTLFGQRAAGGFRFVGSVGEWRIWDTKLTDEQYDAAIANMRAVWQV